MNRTRLQAVLLLTGIALLLTVRPAAGANGDTAFLFGLDGSHFPQISAYLSASNALGARLEGLRAQDVSLKEDGLPARGVVLTEEHTGIRLVVVIDPGMDMLYALPSGEKRIDRIRSTMADWLGTIPQTGLDDLTLITPEGVAVSHTASPETFLDGLKTYAPKIPAERTLDAMLVDALGAAADPLPHPGMRALMVVFSAGKLSKSENIGQGLCPRALELHATLFGIWAGRTEPSAKADMEALGSLASTCGGYSVALESSAGTAAVLSMIATQRTQYRLEYRSAVSASGEHALAAAVAQDGFQAETDPLSFSVTVEPPEVTWIDFPDRLTRSGGEISQPVEDYLPDSLELRAEVTFPDGHPRAVAAMQLFADSELVGECTAGPCDAIRWDLRSYSADAEIRVQMVVRDELGLEGKTEERTFLLTVRRPTFWDIFRAYYLPPLLIVLASAVVVGGGIAVMVNWNRIRAAEAPIFPDVVSLPERRTDWIRRRLHGIRRPKPTPPEPPAEAYAVLEPIGEVGVKFTVAAADVIVGRDPQSAGIVLADPSVSPRHSRIVRMGDGVPWLFDLGSAAGSWINFEEVPPEGAALREGDRLNFGRAAFRVRLRPCEPAKENADEG